MFKRQAHKYCVHCIVLRKNDICSRSQKRFANVVQFRALTMCFNQAPFAVFGKWYDFGATILNLLLINCVRQTEIVFLFVHRLFDMNGDSLSKQG